MQEKRTTSFDQEKAAEGKKILFWLIKTFFVVIAVFAFNYWIEGTLSFRGTIGVLFMMLLTRWFISKYDAD